MLLGEFLPSFRAIPKAAALKNVMQKLFVSLVSMAKS